MTHDAGISAAGRRAGGIRTPLSTRTVHCRCAQRSSPDTLTPLRSFPQMPKGRVTRIARASTLARTTRRGPRRRRGRTPRCRRLRCSRRRAPPCSCCGDASSGRVGSAWSGADTGMSCRQGRRRTAGGLLLRRWAGAWEALEGAWSHKQIPCTSSHDAGCRRGAGRGPGQDRLDAGLQEGPHPVSGGVPERQHLPG